MRFLFFALFLVFAASPAAWAQQVRISGLSDFNINSWGTGDPNVYRYIDICIYRQNNNGNSRRYVITASSNNAGGFTLQSGQNGFYKLPYTVSWFDGGTGAPGSGSPRQLTNNILSAPSFNNARNNRNSPADSSDCNGNSAPTARLVITINASALDIVPDGSYTGSLNLLVAPQ